MYPSFPHRGQPACPRIQACPVDSAVGAHPPSAAAAGVAWGGWRARGLICPIMSSPLVSSLLLLSDTLQSHISVCLVQKWSRGSEVMNAGDPESCD